MRWTHFLLCLPLAGVTETTLARQAPETQAVAELHQLSQAGIKLGNLAASKGQAAQVRDLGRAMVRDLTEVDRRLVRLGETKGWRLGDTPSGELALSVDRLGEAPVSELDRRVVGQATALGARATELTAQAIPRAEDAATSRFLAESLPALAYVERMAALLGESLR